MPGWQQVRSGGLAEHGHAARWRVTLREPTRADGEAVDPWLAEALAAVGGRDTAEAGSIVLEELVASLRDRQRLLLIIPTDGAPKGVILLTEADRQLLTIDALAMAAAARNLGFGAEAVYQLEQHYPDARLIAGIPLTNGLAIYFWLRIGYRPLFPRATQSGLAPDRVWMTPAEGAARDFRPGR